MSLENELGKQSQKLAKMSEDRLLAELGRRLESLSVEGRTQIKLSAADAAMSIPQAPLAGPMSDHLKGIAISFLNRFNKDLYRLMCDANDPDNKKVKEAINTGEESAAILLSGLILVHFAWLPGIVAVVVGLIIRRFVKSVASASYEQACASWGKELGIVPSPK